MISTREPAHSGCSLPDRYRSPFGASWYLVRIFSMMIHRENMPHAWLSAPTSSVKSIWFEAQRSSPYRRISKRKCPRAFPPEPASSSVPRRSADWSPCTMVLMGEANAMDTRAFSLRSLRDAAHIHHGACSGADHLVDCHLGRGSRPSRSSPTSGRTAGIPIITFSETQTILPRTEPREPSGNPESSPRLPPYRYRAHPTRRVGPAFKPAATCSASVDAPETEPGAQQGAFSENGGSMRIEGVPRS